MTHTVDSLCAFNERVKAAFLAKRIRSPVHLCDPNQAENLIAIFKDVRPQDWLFCSWRNHFHCLLKGVPEEELFEAILAGRSMTYCSAKHRIVCSSIVGGILPIACGIALAIKRKRAAYLASPAHASGKAWGYVNTPGIPANEQYYDEQCGYHTEKVHVFVGDMTARTGLFVEFLSYCDGHKLPVSVVIEDNGYSTNTPTEEVWGSGVHCESTNVPLIRYSYQRTTPHVGVGSHVEF